MRTHSLALACIAGLTLGACGCPGNGGNDAGQDGGVDAGPIICNSTADCAAAGAPDLVCDPQEHICLPKCHVDGDCGHVASGVCETIEGVCRPPCGPPNPDYCPTLDAGVICLERTGHCVPRCKRDDDCTAINPGAHCDEPTGECRVPGTHGCSMDTDCNSFVEFEDYCFFQGVQCRCSIESNDSGFPGVCHRRRRSCDECTADSQCGNTTQFDPMGACKTVTGDMTGKKYCLYQHSAMCGCGYQDNGQGFCEPQTGSSCANPGCTADKDCPSGSVCEACLCRPRCRWDFALKQTAAPGCPPGQTCWVDHENLDPTSIYYGSGRCRPPCNNDMECKNVAMNPHGGPKLKCAGEQLGGGGLSEKRCRADGECMDDLECPPQPDTSVYYGYCDRAAFACKTDCRTGNDPVTMKPYDDCRSPYGCIADAGMNVCVLKTCLQQGGASIACNQGEYCCGEDKDRDGQPDPCPPASMLGPEKCYLAPKPPFCTACMSNDDCKNVQLPAYLTGAGACPNGSKSPSCSPYPIFCYYFQEPMTMREINICAPATYNDATRDSFGRGVDTRGCPAGFAAYYQRIRFTMMGDDNCNADADCNQGTDAGQCGTDLTVTLRDGGHPKSCLCTVGSAVQQCPNTPDGGVFSFCQFGNNGDRRACMATVACMPPTAYVFRDGGPPGNGCGF